MFETALIESKRQGRARRRLLSLPAAVAAHVAVLALVAGVQLWAVEEIPAVSEQAIWVTPGPPPAGEAGPERHRPRPPEGRAPIPRNVQPTTVADLHPEPGEDEPVSDAALVPGGLPVEPGTGSGSGTGTGGSGTGIEGPTAAEIDAPLLVGGEVAAPRLLRRVEPAYPEAARHLRRQGVVIVQATIDREGFVANVTLLRDGVGYGAAEAVERAVSQWRYEPARFQGRRVAVLMTITVTFTLT
jgi:protein TonB